MLPLLLASLVLGPVPLVWLARRWRMPRDREKEGKADGITLLFALVFSMFSLFMAVVSGARALDEQRVEQHGIAVLAQVDRCWTTMSRTGGRLGAPSHSLTCSVQVLFGPAAGQHTVVAGYIGDPQPYEEWMANHPPRTTIPLQLLPGPEPQLTGFTALVPATTTAMGAAESAFEFAVVAILLFGASRGIVFARERNRARSRVLPRRRSA